MTTQDFMVIAHRSASMRRVVKAGADGMTVNFPDKLIAYLNHYTHERP